MSVLEFFFPNFNRKRLSFTFFWLKNIYTGFFGKKSNPRLFRLDVFSPRGVAFLGFFFAFTWNQNKANQFVERMEAVISNHLFKVRFGF